MSWSVPRDWVGETAFILGGGASLAGFDAEILRGRGRVIAIKDAGLVMAPWADVLYWADDWWLAGNDKFPGRLPRLGEHSGPLKVCRHPPKDAGGWDIKVLPQLRRGWLSRDAGQLAGKDSGANCINFAWLAGAARIGLLGFDMGGGNWDGRARKAESNNRYAGWFVPGLRRMAAEIGASAEVAILSPRPDSPGSALDCWPKTTLAEFLGG